MGMKSTDQIPYEVTEHGAPQVYSAEEYGVCQEAIDPDALKVMQRLTRHGYKAYLVGGGVRDLLLGKDPKDFDIATSATPRQVKLLFRNCRIIGRRFKLAHVFFANGKIIEVATFRRTEEPEEPVSENPQEAPEEYGLPSSENFFGDELTDAFRRDLTINALFYDAERLNIIDYTGGMIDFAQKKVRIIGVPEIRIKEDPVRILRALRHAVRASFSVEASTGQAIRNMLDELDSSSPVRLFEEWKRDLCSLYCSEFLRVCHMFGVLNVFLPHLASGFQSVAFSNRFLETLERALLLCDDCKEPTLALSIITLGSHIAAMQEGDVGSCFDSEQIVKGITSLQFDDEYFRCLQIPRREKDKTQTLLHCFSAALQGQSSNKIVHQIARSGLQREFKALLSSIPEIPLSEDAYSAFEEAFRSKPVGTRDGDQVESESYRRQRGRRPKKRLPR
jgi:poly(A) polymerase